MKKQLAIAALTSLSFLGIAPLQAQESPTLSGSIAVIDFYYGVPGEPCNRYREGFRDLTQGTTLTVKDGQGNILAVGQIPAGRNYVFVEEDNPADSYGERIVGCLVNFDGIELPSSDFYVITMGNQNRGEMVYSRQQLAEMGWRLSLSIGGN